MPMSYGMILVRRILGGAARRTKDGAQACRLLALAAIYDGASRTEAARIGGVTLQIVRDWVVSKHAAKTAGGSLLTSFSYRGCRIPSVSKILMASASERSR
jgi:hypothetical protein